MIKKFLVLVLFSLALFASNCDTKLFSYANSMDKAQRNSISTFLNILLTQKCNINISYSDNVAREIVKEKMPYLRIKNYTLKQILDLILSKKGLFYKLDNHTLTISYFKTKSYKINFISSTRTGKSNLNATDNQVANKYDFDFWGKIKEKITKLLENNYIIDPNYNIIKQYQPKSFPPIVDKDSGIVIVTGTAKQIKAVDKFIQNLMHSLTKEVLIDVHIYSVELSSSHKTGIDWSQLNIGMSATNVPLRARYLGGSQSVFNSATFNMNGLLNFLAQNGNVNSISNPKIVTLNNQKAIISVGDTIYYKYASSVVTDQNGNPQTQYTIDSKFVGVVLDITPQIDDNGNIILSIAPRISAFRDLNQIANANAVRDMPPDTKDDTMLSVVKLKDNQTLVLGGLITNDESLQVNGVPVLKEIPIIKYLFSSREKVTHKKELVFVITPHIIDFKVHKTLRDLGFGKVQ